MHLMTDVTITHPYTRTHNFKPNSLRDAEALKNLLYFSEASSGYQTRGMALAPLACNSFGQQAPLYQWIVADLEAQHVSLPDFSLPAAAEHP